jgi:putative restriction endonuclease
LQTDVDARVRLAAFAWLEEQCRIYGETLPRTVLEKGMFFEGQRIHLISPQGIFKPAILPEIPLTITTSPNSPYNDGSVEGSYLHYCYRGTDPDHRDNRGLRQALLHRTPLIYLFGVVPGKYLPVWPVYIVGDDREALTFKVQVDEKKSILPSEPKEAYPIGEISGEDPKRRYITVQTLCRLHQQKFRERVLRAYREQCAMCRLRHPELLEAVHIIPDAEPEGEPRITNGIALCNLHHTAYDRFILGVRPDYVIEVRRDILEEIDGPMLRHGLQELKDQKLILPSASADYPDKNKLEVRYQRFKSFVLN